MGWEMAKHGVAAVPLLALLVMGCSFTAQDTATSAAGSSTGTSPTVQSPFKSPLAASGWQPASAAALQKLIPRLMKENAIPGAIVLIRSGEQGDWAATFGTRRLGTTEPLSIDDSVRIGSITKTMTATVLLQLVQEGKLRLEDPVSRHLSAVPNGASITIAQLAAMRSGLYNYSLDKGFNETLDQQPEKVWTPAELLAIAFSHPATFSPGEKFEYSNTNYVLLGLIIEKLTAMPVAEAFRLRIFVPLGLKHTSLPAAADASIPLPHPQGTMFGTNVSTLDTGALPPPERAAAIAGSLKPSDVTNANPSWAWTAGAAIATAGDLATYGKALVAGGLLNAETQKLRLASLQPTDPAHPGTAAYGLGIARFGPAMFGHTGQIAGFNTFLGHDPQADLTLVVATNLATVPATGEGAAVVLAKAILARLGDSKPDAAP